MLTRFCIKDAFRCSPSAQQGAGRNILQQESWAKYVGDLHRAYFSCDDLNHALVLETGATIAFDAHRQRQASPANPQTCWRTLATRPQRATAPS